MKAGKYYVGDLCYVLRDRWTEVCDLIIVGNKCLDGEFKLSDGTEFAIYGTAWGDGVYSDQFGNAYPVDSGSIGCVLVSSITPGELDKMGGNLLDFDHDFETSSADGVIIIGEIEIDTQGYDEDDEDYGEDDEEDY